MLKNHIGFKKIYLACGYTDLRSGIDKLATFIAMEYELNPFDEGTLFLFCGRKNDRIKGLLWEGDGFLLLYKRLEKGRYMWPKNSNDIRNLTAEEYERLVSGFTIDPVIERVRPEYTI